MSRTVRAPKERRRSWYQVERKWARKSTNRKNRNTANQRLRTMKDPDELIIDRPVSTGGWISH